MLNHIEAFHRPASIEEASALLRSTEQKAIIVAGATEVGLRVRSSVKALVDISGLGLDRIKITDDAMHLGAMVRATRIHRDPIVREHLGDALPESAFAIASETVRNLTSLGGNVVHLTSWSDMPPALRVLDANFRIQGARDVYFTDEEFFRVPPKKLLEPGDIVTEVIVPLAPKGSGSAFIKHAKTAVDFALVNGAAYVELDGDIVTTIRLSVGAIHTPPIRLPGAEGVLAGKAADSARLKALEAAAAAEVSPVKDPRASESYLRRCAGVVIRRCVERAIERAGSSSSSTSSANGGPA